MATERIQNYREWATLIISFLTLLGIPVGGLILRNQRLEIRDEMHREYVAIETYRAGITSTAAENAALKAQIEALSAKMDRLQITMVRVTDAVKLSNP